MNTDRRRLAAAGAVRAVRDRGGYARSAALQREGVPKHAIADAVAAKGLIRLRRVWVMLPTADPLLLTAAREGVVLSCVTQAKRLGLWVLDVEAPHVAVPPHAGMVAPRGCVAHRARPLVPRHPGTLVDPVENVLVLVAGCLPFDAALAIWDSALRMQLVDAGQLARLPLPAAARSLLEAASPYRHSGLETFVFRRLRWLDVPVVSQVWIAGHHVDILIGERLVLQIDGGHHVGAQRTSDIEHDAELLLLGYHVIRVGYEQVIHRWESVQDRIARAVAQRLHAAPPR